MVHRANVRCDGRRRAGARDQRGHDDGRGMGRGYRGPPEIQAGQLFLHVFQGRWHNANLTRREIGRVFGMLRRG